MNEVHLDQSIIRKVFVQRDVYVLVYFIYFNRQMVRMQIPVERYTYSEINGIVIPI